MKEKPKIKFLLAQVGKAVIFEIYEMDERFRSEPGVGSFDYLASNGTEILSSMHPYLTIGAGIGLRGDDTSMDDLCAVLIFDTSEEAEAYRAKVLEALKDWADNWEGWDEKPPESNDDPNVYTFY